MPKLIAACLLILAIAQPSALQATDWPDPESAWLKTPDGYTWPGQSNPLELIEVSTAELDAALEGVLIPPLESTVTPPSLLAAWVELEDGGNRSLLYVDPALSGTGGKYLYVVTSIDGEWSWIGEMLCRQVLVGAPNPGGWRDLTCIGQRGLQYQRVLYTLRDGRYCAARNERHDLERGVVELTAAECAPPTDP
jgi:hypothetical protein